MDTIECLESVYQIEYPKYHVIVVDNGSVNDSISKIKEYAEGKIEVKSNFFNYSDINKPIKIIEYSKEEAESGGGKEDDISGLPCNKRMILIKNNFNYGFAEGNNIAIRYAMKALDIDYILLLNNDTVVDKFFLKELIEKGSKYNFGIAGPKVYYYDYKGLNNIIHSAGARIYHLFGKAPPIGDKEVDKGQYDREKFVNYLEGACLLVRREVIEHVGLLDSSYFLYWEETDWCYRALKKGFKSLFIPSSKIWHKVKAKKINEIYSYYMIRNRFFFMKKNCSSYVYCFFLIYYFIFDIWYSIALLLSYQCNYSIFVSYFNGVIDGLLYRKNADKLVIKVI